MCLAVHRYAKANNKYMNGHNPNTRSSYLMYCDANNLYGWTMSQKLLVDGFSWKKNSLRNAYKTMMLTATKNTISYPKRIQKIHNDYGLMLEKCIN